MQWAALISWIVTAGGGFVLLGYWLKHGGLQEQAGGGRIRPPLILSHFGLAATGLVLWIIHVFVDSDALAWIAFVILLAVALLGWTMFAIWFQRRRSETASATIPEPPAEQRFPVSIVALHGAAAVVTVVLVFLAALDVGT